MIYFNMWERLNLLYLQYSRVSHRWSLLLQDNEGTVCDVVLPGNLDQWGHLLEFEGREVIASGLRIQQRVNSTRYIS